MVKPFDKYIDRALELANMAECNPSTSPKLDRVNLPDDEEDHHDAALYRSVVCTLLYVSKRMVEIQATMSWLCKRLHSPNKKAARQLHKLLRYLKGARGNATFYPRAGEVKSIEGYLDGDGRATSMTGNRCLAE